MAWNQYPIFMAFQFIGHRLHFESVREASLPWVARMSAGLTG